MLQKTMSEINKKHCEPIKFLKSKVKYEKILEFEWDEIVESKARLKILNKNISLNPRDALYGWRTNADNVYYKINIDEKIQY